MSYGRLNDVFTHKKSEANVEDGYICGFRFTVYYRASADEIIYLSKR